MLTITIYPVITDNGDGGFTTRIYPSAKERTKAHPGVDEQEDEYENGYLCNVQEIKINKDGSFEAFSIHGGQ